MSILTVSELNRAVAASLERSFPMLTVRGEIAQLTKASSGHWYFSLRDAHASVRAVMFKGRSVLLDWQPKEGDQVEVGAVVTLYEPRGDFQLRVESMVRSGQGALYEAFLARKEKLAKAGLFDDARKKQLPSHMGCVALVTSLGAAALRDVVVTLAKLAPRIRIRLYPSLVQGADAPAMLCEQLARADADREADVIVMVRGGGSLEDLWAFNDESLAYAVASCRLPVIVGVGHETDVTIADFVADQRAATPTAAAQLICAPDQQARMRIAQCTALARTAMHRLMNIAQQRRDLASQGLRSPKEQLGERLQRMKTLRARMHGAIGMLLHQRAGLAARLGAQIQALDPTAILERGYAMVVDQQQRLVTGSDQVRPGQPLSVRLAKGLLDVRVERQHPPKDAG